MRLKEYPIGDYVGKCQTWNPKSSGVGSFDYIDLSSVDKDTKSIASIERYECSDAPSRARQLVETDDVLVATVRPNLNGAALVNGAHHGMTASTGYCVLRPDKDKLDSRFLFHWVKTGVFVQRMVDVATGANYPAVSDAKIKASKIPLPPLAEQKRIAGILDAADALRAKRSEALAQLDTLLQSTFLDMFGDPVTNPMGWEQCVVGDVVHAAKDGPHVSPTYAESGVPFLSTRHIKPGEVVWEDLKYIDQDEANRQWKKCKPEFGDILYTKGGTTGIAARVTTSEPFAVWVHVALLKPIVKKVHPIWIEAMLNSAYCYTQSQRYTHGIANRDLGLKRMVKIQMYLPPLAEQRGFAAVVESIEQQRVRQRAHLAELDTLFASLQSRAFRGDL